jgi:hypothetical protein
MVNRSYLSDQCRSWLRTSRQTLMLRPVLSFISVLVCGLFELTVKQICAVFLLFVGDEIINQGRDGILLTATFLWLSGRGFPCHMSWSFLCFSDLRWEVVIHFVDIDRSVDHHCFNLEDLKSFLFDRCTMYY